MIKTPSSEARSAGLIPGQEAKNPHALQTPTPSKKKKIIKQKQYCNKFNIDFKNGLHQKENI